MYITNRNKYKINEINKKKQQNLFTNINKTLKKYEFKIIVLKNQIKSIKINNIIRKKLLHI